MPGSASHDSSSRSISTPDVSSIFRVVRGFLANMLGINENEIGPDTRVIEDLHVDSLDLIELIEFTERNWEIAIEEVQLAQVRTIGDAAS